MFVNHTPNVSGVNMIQQKNAAENVFADILGW